MSIAERLRGAAADLGSLARIDEPLGPLTTYRVGGPAAIFVNPRFQRLAAAGIATLAELTPHRYAALEEIAAELADGLARAAADVGRTIAIARAGSSGASRVITCLSVAPSQYSIAM